MLIINVCAAKLDSVWKPKELINNMSLIVVLSTNIFCALAADTFSKASLNPLVAMMLVKLSQSYHYKESNPTFTSQNSVTLLLHKYLIHIYLGCSTLVAVLTTDKLDLQLYVAAAFSYIL